MEPTPSPLACDLTTLSEEQRARLFAVSTGVLGAADELRALPDGYSVGYAHASADLVLKMAEFVALDRLCCPFLEHAIVSEAGGGMTWLMLRGRPGAKEVIAGELLRFAPAQAAITIT